MKIERGTWFYFFRDGSPMQAYVLCQVNHSEMTLINPYTGNRWVEPVDMNRFSISKEDVMKLLGRFPVGYWKVSETRESKMVLLEEVLREMEEGESNEHDGVQA